MGGNKKIRVAVLYGGRSGEHEVSLVSAASVMRNLDPDRFEIIPIAIDKQGRWLMNDVSLIEDALNRQGAKALPVFKDAPAVVLPPTGGAGEAALMPLGGSTAKRASIDVVFPVMHGTYCEDGTIQGLLEMADVAYVGCGVLASSVGMDKDVAKRLAREAGLPVAPYFAFRQEYWKRERLAVLDRAARDLGFPVFVKPANSGSSVGVHKVKEAGGLEEAINDAFRYDTKVMIEKGIDAREIELAVLESHRPGDLPLVSVVGEIIPHHEFYSYEAKYLDDNGAALKLPAELSPEQARKAQELARDLFTALECEGMARVDLFLDRGTGQYYFNEVNTIPGFTQISMYPKLWEASGIPYRELLSRLIDLALERQARKRALVRDFSAS